MKQRAYWLVDQKFDQSAAKAHALSVTSKRCRLVHQLQNFRRHEPD